MARILMTGLVLSAALAVQACQNETPPETGSPAPSIDTAASEPDFKPDEGKIALETADSLEDYQEAVRGRAGTLCTWSRKNGQPVPVFSRQLYVDAFFTELNALAETDEEAVREKFAELSAEFDDCLRLQIPPSADDTDYTEPDFSDSLFFEITSRYSGMPENMFRLVDEFAHPITFVCPQQTETGSKALIAYDGQIETLWSDAVQSNLETHIDGMFPDMGVSTKPWSLDESSEDDLQACITAFTAATAN